jgi:hypothetical protein
MSNTDLFSSSGYILYGMKRNLDDHCVSIDGMLILKLILKYRECENLDRIYLAGMGPCEYSNGSSKAENFLTD